MTSPILVASLAGTTIGSDGDGFVLAEWQDPGGHNGRHLIAPRHLHHRDDEAWYVLEGTVGVQVGEKEVEARAGAAVLVPRGTPHTYWNAGVGRLRYLLVMTSNTYRLIQAIHANSDRSAAGLQSLFRKYDSEFLGW